MNEKRLIHLVNKYEELYNHNHHDYQNQQRRNIIWDKIGEAMNADGRRCKEIWTRIRDNHRKALKVRKYKGRKDLKPPKYTKELKFLVPHLQDRTSCNKKSVDSSGYDDPMGEAEHSNESSPSVATSFNDLQYDSSDSQNSTSSNSTLKVLKAEENSYLEIKLETPTVVNTSVTNKESGEQDPLNKIHDQYRELEQRARVTNSSVSSTDSCEPDPINKIHIEYVEPDQRARISNSSVSNTDLSNQDPLIGFFMNMARTVKEFPVIEQIKIKNEIFKLVNKTELKLSMQSNSSELVGSTYVTPSSSNH